jgi:hypothetical protein
MTETSKEHRTHPRFAIHGATVRYLIHGPDVRESDFPISYPLMELSRGGMSFITESVLRHVVTFAECWEKLIPERLTVIQHLHVFMKCKEFLKVPNQFWVLNTS